MPLTVSAPGKLMLLGEHAVVYGRPCLVTAVSQRMFATLTILDKPLLELEAPEVGIAGYAKPLARLGEGEMPRGAAFAEVAARNFLRWHPLHRRHGVRIETRSEFSSQFGFGSSSASAVCVAAGLDALLHLSLPKREIFDVACKTVMDVQKKGSGFDAAAAVYGGTLHFSAGGVLLEPLATPELPLVVGYTGIKADTVSVIEGVKAKAAEEPALVEGVYRDIGALIPQAKKALLSAEWKELGRLMNQNQSLLETLGVSAEKLDAMIAAAREAGAYGAKLSGAGKGDCMTALAPPQRRKAVEEAIASVGGQVLDVATGAEGVHIE